MSDSEFEAAFEKGTARSNKGCIVSGLFVHEKWGDALKDKINDIEHYSAPAIHLALKKLGVEPAVSPTAIQRHRKGACSCR